VYFTGQLTHTRRSDGVPDPDGDLRTMVRKKILHYHQLYVNRSDPITFMSLPVDTSGRIYNDFNRLLFLHVHREASALANEIPEAKGKFLFLRVACLVNIKGSVNNKFEILEDLLLLDYKNKKNDVKSRF
jgi:hypothetical protein